MKYLNNLIKNIPNLPIVFQIALFPVLFVLWLILWLFPRLIFMIVFVIGLGFRQKIKPFMETFIEHKNQSINQTVNKLEGRLKEAIVQFQSQGDYIDCEINTPISTPSDINEALIKVQESKENLHNANAELDAAIRDFFSDNQPTKKKPTLPAWARKRFPEDWRSDLQSLQMDWIKSGCSGLAFYFRTAQRLLEMEKARFMIKLQDYRDGITAKRAGSK